MPVDKRPITLTLPSKVAVTLRVPFANSRKSQADCTWKVPATFKSECQSANARGSNELNEHDADRFLL